MALHCHHHKNESRFLCNFKNEEICIYLIVLICISRLLESDGHDLFITATRQGRIYCYSCYKELYRFIAHQFESNSVVCTNFVCTSQWRVVL